MRLIDLDQTIVVPVEDDELGVTCEMQMTVAEMFDRFLEGFEPEIVDAMPVEWLKKVRKDDRLTIDDVETIDLILTWWQQEQEAR